MAISVGVELPDLDELRRDLESFQLGLGREVSRIKADAAQMIADKAKPLTPLGPGPIPGRRHPSDALPHLRDTIKATGRGAVVSDHPAALVHEFGGTIEPRGTPIRIEASHMAERAGEAMVDRVESEMSRRIERLLSRID